MTSERSPLGSFRTLFRQLHYTGSHPYVDRTIPEVTQCAFSLFTAAAKGDLPGRENTVLYQRNESLAVGSRSALSAEQRIALSHL